MQNTRAKAIMRETAFKIFRMPVNEKKGYREKIFECAIQKANKYF